MKRIIFPLMAIMVCLHANPAHAGFALDSDTMRATSSNSVERGSWAAWTNCSDVRTSSAVRGLNFFALNDPGNFSKLTMACRTIGSDGQFGSGYSVAGPLFSTSDSGTLDAAQTDSNSLLPIGLSVSFGSNGTLRGVSIYQATAENIVDHNLTFGECESSGENSGFSLIPPPPCDGEITGETITSGETETGSSGLPAEPLMCREGYVLTGLRTRVDSASSPYRGKVIDKISIECTELIEE